MKGTLRQVQKKYGSRAMLIAITVGLAFILAGYKPIGKGVVLGTLFSILNFVLMGETLPLKLVSSKRKASLLSFISICFRYALLAVPLIVAVKMPQIDLAATVIGIFMVQLILLVEHGYRYFQTNRRQIKGF
jgi:Ca2+/Na+ antiporter